MGSDIFTVLADPTRRQLVEVLHRGESSVGQLADQVTIAQPGVSRHLRILDDAGIVHCRKEGQRRMYSIRPGSLRELDQWVRRYVHDQSERLDRLAAVLPPETP